MEDDLSGQIYTEIVRLPLPHEVTPPPRGYPSPEVTPLPRGYPSPPEVTPLPEVTPHPPSHPSPRGYPSSPQVTPLPPRTPGVIKTPGSQQKVVGYRPDGAPLEIGP